MSLELAAKEILETGDIKAFEEFIVKNSNKMSIKHLFKDRTSFAVILIQTYRKIEKSVIDGPPKLEIDDYKHCLNLMVEMGCDLDVQDSMERTFAHWTIMLHYLEFLSIALKLGCNVLLQDSEGETIVHLAIRYNAIMALEMIKLYGNNQEVFEAPSKTSGATPLIYAVQIGATEILKKLLQLSVDVDAQENNKFKRTALHYALFTNNEEIFTILLKNKAKPDIKDSKDNSVLDRAANHPKDNFLKILTQNLNSDASSKSSSSIGYSPVITACKNTDYSMLCDLIDKEPDHSSKLKLLIEDSESRTPLHHCAENPDIRCAEKLIELNPSLINKKDKNGFTVLHLATIANNKKLIQLLIRNGCNIKEKDNEGHTCLHWAVVCCASELIDLFLKSDQEILNIIDNHGASPLHYATQSFLSPDGSIQGPNVIENLLKNKKIDVNCVDYDNRTPLLWASSLGISDCCQILLENGADIHHRDINGLSVLHCAASRGHYDVTDLLVNTWSFPVDIEDNNRCTPLFYAVTLKHMSIMHFLMEQRSNLNQQDIKGRSIAHCAALKGYCDVLDLIKKIGGSLTLKNRHGDLPLHEAAEIGKSDVCETLLKNMRKSNELHLIDELNNDGLSPLHKAAKNNYHKICKLLLENGANVNLLTDFNHQSAKGIEKINYSALDLATNPETIALLKELKGVSSKELKKESKIIENKINELNVASNSDIKNSVSQNNDNKPDDFIQDSVSYSLMPNNHRKISKSFQSPDNFRNRKSVTPKHFNKINQSSKSAKLKPIRNNLNLKYRSKKGVQEYPSKTKSKTISKYDEKYDLDKQFTNKTYLTENSKIFKETEEDKIFQSLDRSKKIEQPLHYKKPYKGNNKDDEYLENGNDQFVQESFFQNKSNKKVHLTKTDLTKMVADKNIIKSAKTNYENNERISSSDKFDKGDEYESLSENEAKIGNANNVLKMKNYNYYSISTEKPSEIGNSRLVLKCNEKPYFKTVTDMKNERPGKLQNIITSERNKIGLNKSMIVLNNQEIKYKSKNNPTKLISDIDILENEEIKNTSIHNFSPESNLPTNSICGHTLDHGKFGKIKQGDLFSRIIRSVREYENIRYKMRSISDQRRMEMYQSYSNAMKLDKMPMKNTIRLEKPKIIVEENLSHIELPELALFDSNTLQNPHISKKRPLFPTIRSKEEQIRSAYESRPPIHSLILY